MDIRINQMDHQLFDKIRALKEQNSRGRIVNKFDKVINFEFSSPHCLIAIAIDSVVSSPGMLKTTDMFSFTQLRDSSDIGDLVYFTRGEGLLVGMHKLNYADAATWHYPLQPMSLEVREMDKKDRSLLAFLKESGKSDGILEAFLKHRDVQGNTAKQTVYDQHYIQLLTQLENELTVENLLRFIGLGIGLTPSGDDFATGLLAVLSCYGPGDEGAKKLLTQFKAVEFAHRTTTVSYFMIQNMLENNINQALYDYLISSGSVQEVLKIGSTSGTDMLSGVSFGLAYLLKRKEEKEYGN
ncbi:DUF2877 domain-containing protein [Desemzia sp. C1]|uniref:DUF2877 domain-containing protein n=1 Tax=Desemzia sp. C1 TaxID=2892016 RepID=UPI001E53493E|nr:DUF2877 domain-containing protein [Desemzia sp. C1]MCI3028411.1 DUF2877 domain-containing protein [Desemzia sp. C1]